MSAIALGQQSTLQVCAAAQWVCASERDRFWQAVAAELADRSLAGCIERAIAAALLSHWQEGDWP